MTANINQTPANNVIQLPPLGNVKNKADQLINRWLSIESMANGPDKLLEATKWRDDVRAYSRPSSS